MKKVLFILALAVAVPVFAQAQFFRATIAASGSDLVFYISPAPGSGTINTGWSDIEFFLRWLDTAPSFSFGAITVNTTDFPGINITYNGNDSQGFEPGYTNAWLGTSFSGTAPRDYQEGTEYEVFRVALSLSPSSVTGLELVANSPNYFPHYLALTDQNAGDRTAYLNGTALFYGPNAAICSPNCPATTAGNNHVMPLGAALPVELLAFRASPRDETDALLGWRTSAESNTSHFGVERSADGRGWQGIGTVAAAGHSQTEKHYSLLDKGVFDPDELRDAAFYYRLKMVDLDGSFDYSPVRTVRFESNGGLFVGELFPNPVGMDRSFVQVPISVWEESFIRLDIFDVRGRVVGYEEVNLTSGDNLIKVGTERLATGVYHLKVTMGDGKVFAKKLVVQ